MGRHNHLHSMGWKSVKWSFFLYNFCLLIVYSLLERAEWQTMQNSRVFFATLLKPRLMLNKSHFIGGKWHWYRIPSIFFKSLEIFCFALDNSSSSYKKNEKKSVIWFKLIDRQSFSKFILFYFLIELFWVLSLEMPRFCFYGKKPQRKLLLPRQGK